MSTGTSTGPHDRSTAHRRGIGPVGERRLDVGAVMLVAVLSLGWTWSIVQARSAPAATVAPTATANIKSALTRPDAPATAYLSDAALTAYTDRLLARQRGVSGKLRATIQPAPGSIRPDTLAPGTTIQYEHGGEIAAAPKGSGIWNVVLSVGSTVKRLTDFNVIALLPFSAKRAGHVGLYYLGNWPAERGASGPKKAPPGAYGNPAGFIEVTPANENTRISEHFKLADFLTHDQPNVLPKYLVLQPKLVDKLELVLADLQAHGVDVSGVHVMSGFRTPQYNVGGGNTGGRADLSRHMYGDASDIYIDNDHDGQMDDLNHDGRISIDDSRVILAAVDRVEAAHPELVGGAGVYTAAAGHGPFIHIDTRGYRARWSGTSGG